MSGARSPYSLLVFAGLTALFLLPSFKFWTGPWIYPIDWAERIVIIAVVLWIATRTGERVWTKPKLRPLWDHPLWWGIAIALCFAIFWVSGQIGAIWPDSRWLRFPPYPNAYIEWTDLTLGIALVALSEELVFRWYPSILARHAGWSVGNLYWISGISFVLIHIPQGPNTMILSFVFACILMTFHRRYQSILAPILLHFVYDVLAFSGVFDMVLNS